MKAEKLLLEIGTEEIPARFLPGARRELPEKLSTILVENFIDFGKDSFSVYATPRRLAILLDISVAQNDRVREAFGPPRNVAYGKDGTLTKAGEGFARSQGVKPEDLVIKTKGRGEYVAAVIEEKGRFTEELLPEILKRLVLSIHFPKAMRWGSGSLAFARPIHWIVALYGKKTVEFEVDGIRSGGKSRGHRFLSPLEFAVKRPDDYVKLLRERFVIVDQKERVDIIKDSAGKLCKSVSGKPYYIHEDHPLIVADLVEYPQAVLGSFDKEYLKLPSELLGSVMWGHQKYFSVVDAKGRLKNNFIIVSNTSPDNDAMVRRGAERVLRARFDDARFYFEEDKARTLESRVDDLKKVTFHEKLGSLYEKTMRVKDLASRLSEALSPELKDKVERAAALSKTDLLTGVVYEFPEIQGVMGKYCALNDGEDPLVAEALLEQYLPAFSGDRVPENDAGAIVGLADRMDNVAAFFSIGLKPTGSEDPFALRRQVIAVITILMEKGYPVSFSHLVGSALDGLGGLRGPESVAEEVLQFFEARLEGLLSSKGYNADLVKSVMEFAANDPLGEIIGRLDALDELRSHPSYGEFLVAIKRVRNIIPEGELPPVDEALLVVEEEKALLRALYSVKSVEVLAAEGRYVDALMKLLELAAPINNFFDKVLVMDKDEKIRNNRLSLLRAIWDMASKVADFSKLPEG